MSTLAHFDAMTAAADTACPSWVLPVPLARSGVVTTAAAAASGGMLAAWWWMLMGGAGWVEALVCSAPALATGALALTSQTDREQYVLRLLASAMMLPLLAGFVATGAEGPWNAWSIAALVLWFFAHLGSVVALIAWLASATTRLNSGVASPAAAARFEERLHELSRRGSVLVLRELPDRRWIIDCPGPEDRTHRIEMRLDGARREVRVREVVGADRAAPANADEASMRGPGDHWFDPARPDAGRIWNRKWQATVIKPQGLNALQLEPGATLPAAAELSRIAADPGAVVHLLAALALRAGLAWQPTLARP